jgi:hypothetical protein
MKKIIIFIFISFLLACEAPIGDVGPTGPAGAGGPKGDKGDTGAKGTFSAIVSDWKEIKPANWLKGASDLSFIAAFDEPKLTADITNKGMVLGFYRYLSGESINEIFSVPDETSNYSLGIYASFTSNVKSISYFLDFRNLAVKPATLANWNIKVRYILVPPASAGRLKNMDWKNYNEVKKALNITD